MTLAVLGVHGMSWGAFGVVVVLILLCIGMMCAAFIGLPPRR